MPNTPDIPDLLPGPNLRPESPHPKQACTSISHDDAFGTTRTNSQQNSVLPQLQPSTSPCGRLALVAPPGFEHLRAHPPASIGNQISPGETICESHGHPISDSIFSGPLRYSTEIFYNQVPSPGPVSGSSFTPDAVILGNTPSAGIELSSQAPFARTTSVDPSQERVDSSFLPMHRCFALASTRVVRLVASSEPYVMNYKILTVLLLVRQKSAM